MAQRRFPMLAAGLAATVVLAACETRQQPAPVVFRGTQPGVAARAPAPAAVAPTPVAPGVPTPDANGIVDFGGYRAIIARPGDTVESLAARAGISGAALANYNGFPSGFTPRPGQEVILPPDAPPSTAGSATIAAAPLEPMAVPVEPVPAAPTAVASLPPASAPATAAPVQSFDLSRIEAAVETPTPATAPVQPQAVAVPSAQTPVQPPVAATPAPSATPPAPRAAEPTPQIAAVTPPAATTPAAPPATATPARGQFVRPVNGEVVRPFSRGANRSDGMEFAAPAGTQVVAAAPGQVALVSEALGGNLGTVILVRHADQVLTVYGRVNADVAQGDRVQAGQVIGTVAPAPSGGRDSLHFEVRRGTEPVDPAGFIGG